MFERQHRFDPWQYEIIWPVGKDQKEPSSQLLTEHYISGEKHGVSLKPSSTSRKFTETLPIHFGDNTINIRCIKGEGVALLQKLSSDDERVVKNFMVVHLTEGQETTVPPNFYLKFINTGKKDLVVEDDASNIPPIAFSSLSAFELIRERGFLYDVIPGRDGKPTVVNR